MVEVLNVESRFIDTTAVFLDGESFQLQRVPKNINLEMFPWVFVDSVITPPITQTLLDDDAVRSVLDSNKGVSILRYIRRILDRSLAFHKVPVRDGSGQCNFRARRYMSK